MRHWTVRWGNLFRLLVISGAATLMAAGVASSPLAGAPSGAPQGRGTPKVDICHRGDSEGPWTLISVGAPGAAAHLKNHDDALAGGVTAQTETQLDASCHPVAPQLLQCPRWNTFTEQEFVDLLESESVTDGYCQTPNPGATIAVDLADSNPSALAENGTSFDCALRTSLGFTGLIVLSQAQADQCVAELTAIIQQLSWCSVHPH